MSGCCNLRASAAFRVALIVNLRNKQRKIRERDGQSVTYSVTSDKPTLLFHLFPPSSKNEAAKMEILKLYEQSKALNAAQVGAVNHDSGISSAPSSAGESVSSTDTNHGGSDEDLIDFNQSWRHSRYDNWPPGKTSYTPLF